MQRWIVDGAVIGRWFNIPEVQVINDFVGVGYGLLDMDPKYVTVIHNGQALPQAPKAVLGAGTGLGECYLTWNGKDYDVFPSEGKQQQMTDC